jgi:alanine dehydrogenase
MRIGIPKEIKNHEYRVGMVPSSVREISSLGHQIFIETKAGAGIGIPDDSYIAAGATILPSADDIFDTAEMIVKVKEPQAEECKKLKKDQLLFAYLHLAPDPAQTQALLASGAIAIAYETVTDYLGGLPLLSPMSEVAGRMSIQAGAHCLEKAQGGRGVLLGGVPGVASAKVVVIGGGVVGTNAIRMAMGMEAHVTVIDKSLHRLKELDLQFGSKLNTIYSTQDSLERYVTEADLVVGAVLIPGAAAPRLISKKMVEQMHNGSVIIDVAIDQGGCCETSHVTTHTDPTYVVDGVVHYCVGNMPGAVARTATFALNNATLPFTIQLAQKGYKKACLENPHLLNGLNIHKGMLTYKAVADALNLQYTSAETALSQ